MSEELVGFIEWVDDERPGHSPGYWIAKIEIDDGTKMRLLGAHNSPCKAAEYIVNAGYDNGKKQFLITILDK